MSRSLLRFSAFTFALLSLSLFAACGDDDGGGGGGGGTAGGGGSSAGGGGGSTAGGGGSAGGGGASAGGGGASAGGGGFVDAGVDAGTNVDAGPQKLVFVTSTTQNANLGGLDGADGICAARAGAETLPGTFKAWLSTDSVSASSRLTHATVPYVRVDGVKVADDWTDLTDGTLDAPIEVTEAGDTVGGDAWTGTLDDGTSYTTSDCSGFATSDDQQDALCGSVDSIDDRWTDNITPDCGTNLRIYCIEQ